MEAHDLWRGMWTLLCWAALAGGGALGGEMPPPAEPIPAKIEIAEGPFQPTMESLTKYQCPEWFRDAKFGIWAHWGPQAVPMAGDWYAKHMYVQGHRQYEHHLQNYGHPSEHGYTEIIGLWKAEKWDPDRLMALYKRAGARYFVSMACHHDNFDLWRSRYHRWNAVNLGPKRDVVGDWQKAAAKLGLRFGVSEHMGASFTWWQPSHGADKTGPKAGVPYDGADPKLADLYHPAAAPGDTGWYSKNPDWQREWFARVRDLVDSYRPDLLYTDGGVPFGNEVGLSLIAHFYNADLKHRGGRLEAVYTCKQRSEGRWVEDLERGVMPKINPHPWQTDTSIGDWYYNKNWKFRPTSWVVHMLVDIVSKNGNLLLNVVQRPDGSLDPEAEQSLEQIAAWIAINGEAIYGTRPWLVYGEGAVKAKGGHFGEDFAYSAKDIRFTTKGETLYAIALGWPADRQLAIRSLARPEGENANAITSISLLGSNAQLPWKQTPEALVVTLPAEKPCDFAVTLKIAGGNLKAIEIPVVIEPVRPDAQGNFALLAEAAELHGDQIKTEAQGGQPNIGFWDRSDEWASWKVKLDKPGTFRVRASVATIHADAEFVLEAAGQQLVGKPPRTGNWAEFRDSDLGQLELKQPGDCTISVKARDAKSWKAINLRSVSLVRAQ
ncbi:MAG TPA: alpha-L-fucosidase [Planctomycetota bacterium]|nr:alpha-L-fucosidase [Planctomycetota bacterium]HRR82965.1 alpha-L-fucosidase [Planctomycetota bacterium]HRT96644.1 alpha-L-fucosidase [Planctomycetota bacterium]